MTETVLTFGLALLIILLAQFGERNRRAQWLDYLILLLAALALLAAGILILFTPEMLQPLGSDARGKKFAWIIIGAALLIILPLILAINATRRRQNPTLRGIPWTRPVHLTAWTLLTLFIGSNFAVAQLKDLSDLEIDHALPLLIIQNSGFALAALLGVGWGVRRSWRDVLARLGLRRPTLGDALIGTGMALMMLICTGIMGVLVMLIFGEDMTASSGFNQQIISQLHGAGGVLLMGLATGAGEEMLYRGALQPVAGVWLTSFLFAVSHIQYLSPAIIVIFVLGLMLGYTRNKWGLGAAIWTHALYNALVGLLTLAAMNLDQFNVGM